MKQHRDNKKPWEQAWELKDIQGELLMRLAAAAPDLYRALESVVDLLRRTWSPEELCRALHAKREELTAALSKARGE